MHGGGRIEITPEILLRAYAAGIFPMAEDADDPTLFWVEPRERGVLPLEAFHVSRRLARTVRSDRFEIRVDGDFDAVIEGCAGATTGRDKTWINARIRRLYGELFDLGHCHTVEAYRDGRLRQAHSTACGSGRRSSARACSTPSATPRRSRSCTSRRGFRARGFKLLDTQFVTEHLAQFGAVELPRHAYKRQLREAIDAQADWQAWPKAAAISGAEVLRVLGTDVPA